MRLTLTFLTLTAALFADHRAMLTWEGEVRGGATLFIHGNQVDMEGRETGSITSPKFRFVEPLPATTQRVSVEVRSGRGRVQITEQPTRDNDFTAVATLRNAGTQPVVYSLEFFWDHEDRPLSRDRDNRDQDNDDRDLPARRRTRANEDRELSARRGNRDDNYGVGGRSADVAGNVSWAGQIDQEAIVEFRNRRAFTTVVRGRSLGTNDRAEFTSSIPRNGATVELTQAQGRGKVELMEQPSRENGFAAKIRSLMMPLAPASTT
ncbi:MAG: hypothetical protein WKF37_06040 [Bryobacteraceae bacterium]